MSHGNVVDLAMLQVTMGYPKSPWNVTSHHGMPYVAFHFFVVCLLNRWLASEPVDLPQVVEVIKGMRLLRIVSISMIYYIIKISISFFIVIIRIQLKQFFLLFVQLIIIFLGSNRLCYDVLNPCPLSY